ncbi:hypothetical protein LJC57_02705 [Parabacteroides sp. OttesenSCG-928-G07]|nr:hypothetical protein [Parabacteroides sp. OttesenSCG-928-G07]
MTLSESSVVLSEQEMKQITGGSIWCTCCGVSGYCSGPNPEECQTYGCSYLGCNGSPQCNWVE